MPCRHHSTRLHALCRQKVGSSLYVRFGAGYLQTGRTTCKFMSDQFPQTGVNKLHGVGDGAGVAGRRTVT